ncbi:MAG: hypothetical protein EZS28_050217 [Streblomastix strix]|uniref:Uncharacterized protein n=1 Tax=Streblomastix strix TaxID=222440 RepID=A0A5J4T9Z3_9EUKA|nr:MAG: hypothetical protein EZS28_050217 [Streblomastix strix]
MQRRHTWPGSTRSFEGSISGLLSSLMVFVTAGSFALFFSPMEHMSIYSILLSSVQNIALGGHMLWALLVSFMEEAYGELNDNLTLPLIGSSLLLLSY